MAFMTGIALLGLLLSLFLIFSDNSLRVYVRLIQSACISAAFIYSQLYTSFDPTQKVFSIVMLGFVAALGGLVGGVLAALLNTIATGIELGLLVAIFLSCFGYIANNIEPFVLHSLFAIGLCTGVLVTNKYPQACAYAHSALVNGLIVALSIDMLCGKGLLTIVVDVLGANTSFRVRERMCIAGCWVPYLMFVWVAATLWSLISAAVKAGLWAQWFQSRQSTNEYESADSKPLNMAPTEASKSPQQRTFSYPDTLVFNFFDPDNLHEMLTPYAETVFSSVQLIAKMFGFQIDSSRNQAEHLLMLLTNETASIDTKLNDAPERLHVKLFANYCKWCARMNTVPLFSKPRTGKKYNGYIDDMLCFLLIWGEAANLRHMPECLCFLYHKTMAEYIYRKDISYRSVYPGYFLDMVVTPMYEVVAAQLKAGGDHDERKTYDDFNEFFWSQNCLKYRIFEDFEEDTETGFTSLSTLMPAASGSNYFERKHISRGIAGAKKTYLEKRSWVHSLYSIHRIFEWHVITFTLIASIAFSIQLQWTYSYTFQVASMVFWMISCMGIFWTCLEVWTLYPATDIPTHTILGFSLRIVAGYVVFAYQSVYFHWSFRADGSKVLPVNSSSWDERLVHGGYVTGEADGANFWWWQYLWLSLFALSIYILQMFMCWIPNIASSLMTWDNDYFQALLNICYPFSSLYVGKNVHVSTREAMKYIAYWLTLIAFKFWFGYVYIISPICAPSVMLFDDYMNYQKTSFFKTCLLMFILWVPHFLVYLIDMSIWYAVWSSGVGGFIALIERQGAVRDPATFREHFMRSPAAFCAKLMPTSSFVGGLLQRNISTASIANLSGKNKNFPIEPEKPAVDESANKAKAQQRRSFSSADLHAAVNGKSSDTKAASDNEKMSYQGSNSFHTDISDGNNGDLSDFLDKRSMRWVVFSHAWNEIISNLRKTDHLSNVEVENLTFSNFDWLSKPVYLPLYQTAACVESTAHLFKEAAMEFRREMEPHAKLLALERFKAELDVTTLEAVGECFELVSFLIINLLGTKHETDTRFIMDTLYSWATNDEIFLKVDPMKVLSILGSLENISVTLKDCVLARKQVPVVTDELLKTMEKARKQAMKDAGHMEGSPNRDSSGTGGMRRSVSTGFLSAVDTNDPNNTNPLMNAHGSSPTYRGRKFEKLQPFRKEFVLNDHIRDKLRDDLRALFSNIRGAMTASNSEDPVTKDIKDRTIFLTSLENGFLWDDIYASSQIDDLARDHRIKGVLHKLHGLLKLRRTEVDPVSAEATRRIHFFINSLFMEMPNVPNTRYCREYTCMTPFYSEDVLLTRADLESKNSDGISTLLYLQTLYRNDWNNFCERRSIKDDSDLQVIWSHQHLLEIRMWASYRAQTLFRTVEGIMYTEAAIRLVCELEKLDDEEISVLAPLKFNYVVACQVYGQQRKKMEHKADDIDFLLLRHPNLRVAYIDSFRSHHDGEVSFYSVLIKHDFENKAEPEFAVKAQHEKGGYRGLHLHSKEVYRVKLPGNAVLGEGKPENQNNAIIFSRGRFVQAMDMNQDGYFEEAFKMRNLLEEFQPGTAIVGFREHIFTGSVSSVANYMALQELSFVTLGQRVLCNPLRIRQHYGHPDLFNKFFVMTEGGMSKASNGINLSEDVFAGFNATIRGHTVSFKEYVYAGKGRDVGLQQTYKFEAKLSQGNAEQSLSRDMSRLCDRLDFFRLMSFYYGGIGHYLANTMVMFTLVTVVYFMVGLAVYDEEGVNGRKITPEGMSQILLSGMGILQTLPLFVTLTVEKGITRACSEIFVMILSGGPLYFIFHIQTKAYYFSQTLMAGGAMYRPTGRGFVTRHSPFDENYRFFASSHIYLGFDLLIALLVLAVYSKTTQYYALTWSLWMAVASFLIGPFWFNPITFEWDKVIVDYVKWSRWMAETGGSSEQSWETWWKEENEFYKRTTLSWKLFLVMQKSLPWATVSFGLFGTGFFSDTRGQFRLMELLGILLAYFVLNWVLTKLQRNLVYATRRAAFLLLNISTIGCLIYLFFEHELYVRFSIALYYLLAAVTFIALLWAPGALVLSIYKAHDYVVGHTLFFIIGVMSTLQMGYLQTWLLYHNALSAGVAIEDVLKFARKNKEKFKTDTTEQVNELKAQVLEQERLLKGLVREFNSSKDNLEGFSNNTNSSRRSERISAYSASFEEAQLVGSSTYADQGCPAGGVYGSTGSSEPLKIVKGADVSINRNMEAQMHAASSALSAKRQQLVTLTGTSSILTANNVASAASSVSSTGTGRNSRSQSTEVNSQLAIGTETSSYIQPTTNSIPIHSLRDTNTDTKTSSKSSLSSLESEKAFVSSFVGDHKQKPPPKDFTFWQPTDLPPPHDPKEEYGQHPK